MEEFGRVCKLIARPYGFGTDVYGPYGSGSKEDMKDLESWSGSYGIKEESRRCCVDKKGSWRKRQAGIGWLLAVKRSKGRPCIWPDKWEDSREPHSSQSGASLHLDQIQISQSYSSKNTANERQRPAPLSI
ncbi:hypothetical protein F2Q69_00053959 [Brassica cretica]|uniref:Uncharacterized protein n=1 Tax=Brassica cretica TaxID=69181 RepID=A0A8S9N267_BRACR|nr:hypothetical protein F2Q69_00053959 [Brassica cretica]